MKTTLLLAGLLLAGTLSTPVLAQSKLKQPTKQDHSLLQRLTPAAPRATAVVRPGRAVAYAWDDATNAWIDPVRITYTYNGQGNPTLELVADSATNANLSRVQYTYDAQGRMTQELNQVWSAGAWENQGRYIVTYDAQGSRTEELFENWRNGTWSTAFGSRYANTYDSNVLTSITTTRWENGTYVNDRRELYTLLNGRWNTITQQTWAANNWQDEERYIDIVWTDWAKRQPASATGQQWAMGWSDYLYITAAYSPNGNSVVTYQVPAPNNTRVNSFRISELFDAYGNETNYREEEWLSNAWQLESESRQLLRYDAAANVTRRTAQQYDRLIPGFINVVRYNYGGFVTITRAVSASASAQLQVYPTSTTGQLTVQLPAAGLQGEVMNALGQTVLRVALPAATATLDVSGLTAGAYTLRVLTPQGVAVRRFVRQ